MNNDKELHKKVEQKKETDENNVGKLDGKRRKSVELETENLNELPQLFGIPMDEQTYRISQGPRRGVGSMNNRRIQRYGTIWLQQQKMPTTREKILRKMKTEARAKEEEKDEEDNKNKEGAKVADEHKIKAEEI